MPFAPDAPRIGPIRFGAHARAVARPAVDSVITGGFWAQRQQVVGRVGIPRGLFLLESAGNLHDLRLAAGTTSGEYRGSYPFTDSDVYKWLEAASWQLARLHPDGPEGRRLAGDVERVIDLIAGAQQRDGYINSWFHGRGAERFADLRRGHELYCAGHLIQAAVAHHRATGRERLLTVARDFADHIDARFGPVGSGKPIDGVDGHPGIETALVELYRETGSRRYLDLARYFVDGRGHGLLGGEAFYQDRVPVRKALTVEGHAVRQLYLLAAVADLAAETGSGELRAAGERLWSAMAATKTYLTGGVGARRDKGDFGDPYELPADQAGCETCAAVASIQFSWRMALLTGDARYSDLIERTLFNGLLSGMSLDGESWLCINPLHVRDGHADRDGDASARRARWPHCACCPPNVMRLLASLEHYMSSTNGYGIRLHQYATGTFHGEVFGAPVVVSANTSYPWQGRITVTVDESPNDRPWTLSLRIPQWCTRFTVRHPGPVGAVSEGANSSAVLDERTAGPCNGWVHLTRAWSPGSRVVLELAMEPRLTRADPRVDALRDCVAIERGPLVYCLEQVDHPGGGLDRIVLDSSRPLTVKHRPDLLGGVTAVLASGYRRAAPKHGWWPYISAWGKSAAATRVRVVPIELTAVPYYAWANRQPGSMRVWLPEHQPTVTAR